LLLLLVEPDIKCPPFRCVQSQTPGAERPGVNSGFWGSQRQEGYYRPPHGNFAKCTL
jgi:hypothetical protein